MQRHVQIAAGAPAYDMRLPAGSWQLALVYRCVDAFAFTLRPQLTATLEDCLMNIKSSFFECSYYWTAGMSNEHHARPFSVHKQRRRHPGSLHRPSSITEWTACVVLARVSRTAPASRRCTHAAYTHLRGHAPSFVAHAPHASSRHEVLELCRPRTSTSTSTSTSQGQPVRPHAERPRGHSRLIPSTSQSISMSLGRLGSNVLDVWMCAIDEVGNGRPLQGSLKIGCASIASILRLSLSGPRCPCPTSRLLGHSSFCIPRALSARARAYNRERKTVSGTSRRGTPYPPAEPHVAPRRAANPSLEFAARRIAGTGGRSLRPTAAASLPEARR